MKKTNIKGKEYIEVSERVKFFNENYRNGAISTAITYEDKYVRCRAIIVPDIANPQRIFTGHAEEDREQGNINRTNATENCETSAVGRALGLMGIGIVDSIASADEVRHAIHKQEDPLEEPTKLCTVCNKQHRGKYDKCFSCYYKKGADNLASG